MVADVPFVTYDEFAKAFASILESLDEESGGNVRSYAPDHQKRILTLYKLITCQEILKGINGDGNITDLCDSLLSEWEESAPPSSAIQQLVTLMNKPVVKALFAAFDSISNQRYFPQLPEIPFEVDDDEGVAVKIVRLIRGSEPLGATIKGDANGAVFIARVIAGGVADRSACIQVGDRLMEVNNVSVTGMKPTDIVKLLSDGNGTVVFKLIPARIPTIVESGEKRHLRALADYSGKSDSLHPCPEAALSFRRGDILELLVTADEHWWQARSLGHGAFAFSSHDCRDLPEKVGLIPSELLHSKIRAQKDFEERSKFSRKTSRSSLDSHETLFYEPVCLAYPDSSLIRPIVLIGPSGVGRNELKRRLILSNCEKFTTTVPHTSRLPRPHETDGIDYYFAKREDMEQWILQGRFLEFGEYKGNLYGTLVDSVIDVMKKGRTPVLNPHPLALRILRTPEFKSFVVFICPPSLEKLRETRQQRNMLAQGESHANVVGTNTFFGGFTDTEFEQMIAASEQLYQIYGQFFDVVLTNENLEATAKQLCQAVAKLDNLPSWVPANWIE